MLIFKHTSPKQGQGSLRRALFHLPRSQTLLLLTHSNQASRVAWSASPKFVHRAPSAAVITSTCRSERVSPAASTRDRAKWNHQRRRSPITAGEQEREWIIKTPFKSLILVINVSRKTYLPSHLKGILMRVQHVEAWLHSWAWRPC